MRIVIFMTSMYLVCHVSFADNRTVIFPNACLPGQHIIIAAVGDVLLHQPLQQAGQQKGFETLWEEALPYIHSADLAYANLEGPIAPNITASGKEMHHADAGNQEVYSSYPAFNYPPTLAHALKNSGFAIVSTANNHALDRSSIGVDKTIKTLAQAKLPSVGTRTHDSQKNWYEILIKKNFKIAWIACTEHTNGILDAHHQILSCYKKQDTQEILNLIHALKYKVDAIIVLPHWGEEYQMQPNHLQIQFAHRVLEAGATAVIGSHPHVLQPLQQYKTHDGRATLIMYSLGNFVSYQAHPEKRTTIVLLLGLTKTPYATIINGVRFVPMYMQNRDREHLHLTRLPANQKTAEHEILSRVMPMGNVWYSTTLITNPECFQQPSYNRSQ
ncbi:MAG: CapA family protein [Gammaproteobacteria bacterium]|nr:CapA family protein [Gammaproteobacteria bacterium]